MKPLSEWPDDVLRQCLFTQSEDSPQYYWNEKEPVYAPEALAELLRRKEQETIERCAKLCDEQAESERQAVLAGRDDASVDVEWELRDMASQIRGLQ